MVSEAVPVIVAAILIVVAGWIKVIGPAIGRYVQTRIDTAAQAISDARAERENNRQLELAEIKAEIARERSTSESIEKLTGAVLEMTHAMSTRDERWQAELHSNTSALSGNTQTLGDLQELMDKIVNEGSAPLQAVQRQVSSALDFLGKIHTHTAQLDTFISTVSGVLVNLNELKTTADRLEKVAAIATEIYKRETSDSQRIQAVTPENGNA